MKKLIMLLIITLLLAGCDTNKDDGNSGDKNIRNADKASGYQFDYNGVAIHMNDNAEPIVDALGTPMEYFEAPSCAFQGLDKIYYYGGFQLSTYPGSDGDYISAVEFTDDSVSTKEGICLGDSREKIVDAYGNGYTENSASLIYTKGNSNLTFLMEENAAAAIHYEFITD